MLKYFVSVPSTLWHLSPKENYVALAPVAQCGSVPKQDSASRTSSYKTSSPIIRKSCIGGKACRKDGVYAIINHSFSLFCKCYCFDLSFNLIWKNQSLASNFSILVKMKLKNVVIYEIDISFGPSTIKSNLDHDKP